MWPDEGWTIARRCGAKHISKSKVQKTDGFWALLDVQMSFRVAGARNCALCQKWAKREGFVAFPKKRWQAWDILGGRRSTRDMFIRDVRRSGRWFRERGCILEHQVFSFGKMILCDRCSTSYDLAFLFRGGRSTLDRWNGKIARHIGTTALNFPFLKEVSQNCCVFDVVKFKNWGSLAE